MGDVASARQSLSLGLRILLVFTIGPGATTGIADQGAGPEPTGGTASSYPGQGVAATAEELQSLVAPIALYPDALVAQAIASYWREQNKTLTGSALTTAVDSQTWDPSVKALTQFPSVLNNMAKNLSWTSQLGEDYHNQQADVMAAAQTLHEKAKAAGNLQSGARSRLSRSRSPQVIVIKPTNSQVVYVSQYNPTVIYGPPYVAPGFSTGNLVTASVLSFRTGWPWEPCGGMNIAGAVQKRGEDFKIGELIAGGEGGIGFALAFRLNDFRQRLIAHASLCIV